MPGVAKWNHLVSSVLWSVHCSNRDGICFCWCVRRAGGGKLQQCHQDDHRPPTAATASVVSTCECLLSQLLLQS